LQKGVHVAICALWSHPDGAELRLTVDGKLRASDATHHTWALPIVAHGWKERRRGSKDGADLNECDAVSRASRDHQRRPGETSPVTFSRRVRRPL